MFIIKLNKHDKYVTKLCEQIKGTYDTIDTHVSLENSRRTIAEVDIIARKGNRIDVYEVKCSYRIVKARKQLKRIKRLLSSAAVRVNLFFFCGASSSLEEIVF